MLGTIRALGVGIEVEVAVGGGQFHRYFALNEALLRQAILDEVLHRNQLQAPLLRHYFEVGHAGHFAVFLQYFHQHPGWLEPREAGQIHSRLGVSGAAQHAFLTGLERENMARPAQVGGLGIGVDEAQNRLGAVGSRDARRHAIGEQIDAHRKWRGMDGGIAAHHQVEAQLVAALGGKGGAHQAAPVGGHKVDDFGRGAAGGANKIAFVFAVFVVHNDNDLASANVFDGGFDGVKHRFYKDGITPYRTSC